MPSIMDAMDALMFESKDVAKRSYKAENFPNLSINVQKLLANLPLENEDGNGGANVMNFGRGKQQRSASVFYASLTPSKQQYHMQHIGASTASLGAHNKSTESLDIISPNVQKMLSNLPDTEVVALQHHHQQQQCKNIVVNSAVRHVWQRSERNNNENQNADALRLNGTNCEDNIAKVLQDQQCCGEDQEQCVTVGGSGVERDQCATEHDDYFLGGNRPLGTYLQRSSGIASRTPVGRKNLGKYLQIPSEGTNTTLSSEVSRPVSLTSLGSCSSSSSSGMHQHGSAYLASAESLDSDNEPTGSQGSADSGIAEPTTMGADMRVLHEVLDTEAIYVDDLHHVITGYLDPWRNDPDCPIREHLPHLFNNLEAIHAFNARFLEHVRAVPLDATHVANAFLQHDAGFSIYTEYCTNYPRTINILTDLTRNEATAKLFRERQQALHHALPLGSYLLKPVQRILKYHLFLQRLSKQCDDYHKSAVDLALATMTAVATHINTMKRKHEHAVRVQEIQALLYGWNGDALTALGELIAEGTFRVGGARGRRHVFLFDKLLMMAKSRPDGAFGYKTHIMCSNLMLVEQVKGEPLSFHILPFDNPRNQYTLRARSTQHKREWTLQIKRVILENYNAVIPNHARQLVMQLGQDIQECSEEQYDKSSPIKQHTTPQYLERRGRFRKTRDFTSARRANSQDRAFPSLAKWRRQSDPSGCQYNNGDGKGQKKTPKAKKSPDSSVFYTDLSDSENCDMTIGASIDSLNVIQEQEHRTLNEMYSATTSAVEAIDKEKHQMDNTIIAQVVSDLLMQNQDFHKVLSKQRRNMKGSHSCYGNSNQYEREGWKNDDECINKSDSLPRSFQLNDKTSDSMADNELVPCESLSCLHETDHPEHELEEDQDDYPEHKIYRKSTMRFSLLQRFRAILSEDGKSKLPTYKQGSKSMGAKIANPDYADPHKIIVVSSDNTATPSVFTLDTKDDLEEFVLPRCNIDINETDVLKELDRRLSQQPSSPSLPSQEPTASISHANNDESSYYESLLDMRLTEEESNIEKSDSFRSTNNDSGPMVMRKPYKSETRRPCKSPPPIPAKPKFLAHSCTKGASGYTQMPLSPNSPQNYAKASCTPTANNCVQESSSQKGWVKTIIDRFE